MSAFDTADAVEVVAGYAPRRVAVSRDRVVACAEREWHALMTEAR